MTINKEKREKRILVAIIKDHIETARPVGSEHIARRLKLSSATIRNVMFELERKGYVSQPHTSAGRIPTDLGYRAYVDSMRSVKGVHEDDIFLRVRQYVMKKRFFDEIIEATSRAISNITQYTGIALSPSQKLYFRGMHHMLEHPEFSELGTARDFLRAIEERQELAQCMHQDLETRKTTVRIGRENVCNEMRTCTMITSAYTYKKRKPCKT